MDKSEKYIINIATSAEYPQKHHFDDNVWIAAVGPYLSILSFIEKVAPQILFYHWANFM